MMMKMMKMMMKLDSTVVLEVSIKRELLIKAKNRTVFNSRTREEKVKTAWWTLLAGTPSAQETPLRNRKRW
jgi:hypothetical protein